MRTGLTVGWNHSSIPRHLLRNWSAADLGWRSRVKTFSVAPNAHCPVGDREVREVPDLLADDGVEGIEDPLVHLEHLDRGLVNDEQAVTVGVVEDVLGVGVMGVRSEFALIHSRQAASRSIRALLWALPMVW